MRINMRLVLFSIALFAFAVEVSSKPEETEKVEETQKRAEKTGLMVAVPVDITGGEQSVDTWLSVITGKLFDFRLQAKRDIFTVPIDSVYRRFSEEIKANNTVSSGRYADLAEEFNTDYVLHTTIEYDKGTEGIILMMELKSVNSDDYSPYEKELSASEINRELDAGIEWVFQEVGADEIPRELNRFYSIPVISKDIAILKQTGELILKGYFAEGDEYLDIIDRMDKVLSRDSRNLIVQFAIAQLTERAGNWELAADEYEGLVSIIPNYPVIYTSLCRTLRLNGEYKKALDYAESAEKKKIRNRALLIEGALSLEALGRFSKAERIFDPVLKSDPDNIYALRFFARKYNREDEPEKALEFSNKLLSLEPENGHGMLEKGRALKKLEKYESAIEYLKRAVSVLKDKREALQELGDIHFIKENYTTSAEHYDRILDSWEKSYDVFLNSAAAWTRAERPEKALDVLVEAESLFSDSSDLFKKLGLLYYELKDTTRAVLFLEKYRSVREEVETLLPLGEIYASKGKYDKAFYMYNHALDEAETEDEEILCQFNLAKLYLRQKNTSPVIKILGKILEKRPEYSKVHLYMGDAWFIDKNYEKALEHYLESRKRGVEPLRVLGRIAFIRYHFGNYEEAVKEYLNYVEKEKDNPQAFYNLAVSELHISEIKRAETHLKKGLSLGKPGSTKWFEIAEGYEVAGKTKRVIDAYKKGLAIEPDHRKALLSLSEAYEKAGDMVSVADCYMRVFDLDNEEHKDLLAKAGLYYEENGKTDKAREAYTIFVDKGYENPEIYLNLAMIEYSHKEYKKVITLFQAVDASLIDTRGYRLALARSYINTGKHESSLKWLKKILDNNPDDVEVLEELADAYDKLEKTDELIETCLRLVDNTKGKKLKKFSYKAASLYEKEGDIPEAVDQYKKNINLVPKDIRNYDRLTDIYSEQGEWSKAREVLENAVKLEDSGADHLLKLAEACMKLNDEKSAVQYYKKYLDLKPRDFDVWVKVGDIYLSHDSFKKAALLYKKAVDIRPEDFEIAKKLSITLINANMKVKAVSALNHAHKLKPGNAKILKHLAASHRSLGNKEELAETLNKLCRLEKENKAIHEELGRLYLRLERPDSAITYLEKAVDLDDEDVDLHVLLAKTYNKQDNDKMRYKHIDAALEVNEKHAEANYLMGTFFIERNKMVRAQKYFSVAISSDPNHAKAQYQFARLLYMKGELNEALSHIEMSLKQNSYNVNALVIKGRILRSKGKYEEALEVAERAMDLDSESIEILTLAGLLYKDLGNMEKAEEILRKAQSFGEDESSCYKYLGEIYFSQFKASKAESYLRMALEKQGYDEEVALKLGRTLLLSYNNKEALEMFKRILRQNPECSEARARAVHAALTLNNYEEAKSIFEERKGGKKTFWDHIAKGELQEYEGKTSAAQISYTVALRLKDVAPAANAGLGRIDLKNKDYNSAIINLSKALTADPYNPFLMLSLAKAYVGSKQFDAAVTTCEEVMEQYPKLPESYWLLSRVYMARGNIDKAERILREGLEKNSDAIHIHAALGKITRKRGNYDEAIEYYEEAAKDNGNLQTHGYLYIADIYENDLNNSRKAERFYERYMDNGGNEEMMKKVRGN